MDPQVRRAIWGVSLGLLGALLSQTSAAQAQCHSSDTIAGLDFGDCNDRIGISVGEVSLSTQDVAQFEQRLASQLNGEIIAYNAQFPAIYAQWQSEQRVALTPPAAGVTLAPAWWDRF